MHEEPTNVPLCPGCHFRCLLDDPHCARGFRFQRTWEEGGEIPERRRPGQGGPKPKGRKGHPNPFSDPKERLPFLLKMAATRPFESRREGDAVLQALQMHEGYASVSIISERARQSEDVVFQILDHLEDFGLVEYDHEYTKQPFFILTEAGQAEVQRIAEERTENVQKAFADFSDEELETLEMLLKKILD